MIKIKNINTALEVFEEASKKQGEASEQGDFKTGNKSYLLIKRSVDFLKSQNAVDKLNIHFNSQYLIVRLWAACYLLPISEQESIKILEEISNCEGIHSFTAEMTLKEWRKGNLKF